MEHQRQILRLGAIVIVLAAAIRLVSAGFFTPAVTFLQQPQVVSFLMYLETGHVIRFADKPAQEQPEETSEPQPTQPAVQPEPVLPTFSEQDLSCLQVQYHCDYRPELLPLLTKPLTWDLTEDAPTVLIIHTHATETYADEAIEYSGTYRTLQEQYNMLSIGDEIARVLERGGVTVLHDRTLHDYPDYNNAYAAARTTVQAYLEQYPSIRLVLDIHRDALESPTGQLITSATAGGQ